MLPVEKLHQDEPRAYLEDRVAHAGVLEAARQFPCGLLALRCKLLDSGHNGVALLLRGQVHLHHFVVLVVLECASAADPHLKYGTQA